MFENATDGNEPDNPSPARIGDEEVRKSVEAEINEMEKYKWCLGVQLKHDPLRDRSLNDIYCEWIDKYAAEFRKNWESGKKQGPRSAG